jgi:putative lipoprotein
MVTETVTAEPTPAITAITGSVVYRQRMALAPDAVVEVVLQDTSRADAPALTLGSQTLEARGAQVPIPFVVEYDLSQIDPAGLYTLRATIKEGGRLTWTSTEMIPVITRGAPTDQVDITVQPVNAGAANKQMGTLSGTVTYLRRIALPPNAVVEVTLEDISRADAPATVVAQQIIETNGRQAPIDFTLEYDPGAIDPAARYNVRVRITVDGKLAWISDTITPVLTRGGAVNNVEIILQPVSGS